LRNVAHSLLYHVLPAVLPVMLAKASSMALSAARAGLVQATARAMSSGSNPFGVYDPKEDELWEPPTKDGAVDRSLRTPDLRSDTVTKPTAEMLIAIMDAPVGDDVYGEDPTVNRLQSMVAERLDKEAALFVPSGTMGNLIAIAAQTSRGEEVICGDEQHIFRYEQSGISQLFGIGFHTIPQNEDGTFNLTKTPANKRSLEYALESRGGGRDPHYTKPTLIAIENTHNRCGGAVLPQAWVDSVVEMAHSHGCKVHMDGARLYNAAVASGQPIARLVKGVDSVSLCLSKGLGAPMGSVIAGSADFIAKCHRLRKVLGGGMRQAGVAAACGIVGLKEVSKVLGADHARAKSLARGLAAVPGVVLDARKIQTNIVFFDLDPKKLSVDALKQRLKEDRFAGLPAKLRAEAEAHAAKISAGGNTGENAKVEDEKPPVVLLSEVLKDTNDTSHAFSALIEHFSTVKIGAYGGHRLRAVTHYQVRDDDIERLIDGAYKAAEALKVE
jgi:threonine aldolase